MTRERLFRGAVVVAGLAMLWTVLVMWTGGTVFYIGGTRISSRAARNPALLMLLGLAVAWLLAPPGRRNRTLADQCIRLIDSVAQPLSRLPRVPRPPQVVAGLIAIVVVIVGVTEGAFVIGGSDSYGYVSQAHLWATGELRQEPALSRPLAPEVALALLAPLGYRPTIDGRTIAPTYSPGLPIVMAIFERLAGPESVFWVVPIFGGVLVWLTYLLGVRTHGPVAGVVAALLVATCPPFLYQLTTAPMSDLPVAAWWTLALVLVSFDRRVAALAAGAAAGMAILTRPNLAPLLPVVVAFLIWRLVAAGRSRWQVVQHVCLFGCFAIPTCIAIAILNRSMWGGVLKSGYGSLYDLYSLSNIWPNTLAYVRVMALQMPLVLLVPIAMCLRHTWRESVDRTLTLALGAVAVAVVAMYLAYPAFDSEWNLRFLLPAIPPLVVLAAVAALSLAGRLVETHRAACVLVLIVVTGYGVDRARDIQTFNTGPLRKFANVGEYIKQRLPERAVLLAMLHSGSATYYSGRPTVRYDLIAPTDLDGIVVAVARRGYVPYLLLDDDERAQFQSQYSGHSRLGALDWPPVTEGQSFDVEIYAIPAQPR